MVNAVYGRTVVAMRCPLTDQDVELRFVPGVEGPCREKRTSEFVARDPANQFVEGDAAKSNIGSSHIPRGGCDRN